MPPETETPQRIFVGAAIHSLSQTRLQIIEKAAIGVSKAGKILFVEDCNKFETPTSAKFPHAEIINLGHRFIIPGFVDGHCHAPQHSFSGTGMDLPLLDWLNKYTFPHEAKFADPDFARRHYEKAVKRFLFNGTTTCSYFATVHLESTKILAEIVSRYGQRGLIGKVNMDSNCPANICETAESSISETAAFISHMLSQNNPLLHPVITPRFAPSCSPELLSQLGALSISHTPPIRVQSHLSENKNEIVWIKQLFPNNPTYAHVYDAHNLLHSRTYMAHCIYCTGPERALLKTRGTSIIHCPNSNFSIGSGVLNVRRLLREGVKCGLGTDVAGGYSPSILDALRQAITASKMVTLGLGSDGDHISESQVQDVAMRQLDEALTYTEAFYLATLGGAEAVALESIVGNFVVGKEFDALVVNVEVEGSPVDVFDGDGIDDLFQRFLFLGDDRNIEQVYVQGIRRK